MLNRFGTIVILALLAVLLWQTHVSAQSAANLQADLFRLRSEMNLRRAQPSQSSGNTVAPRRISDPWRGSFRGVGPSGEDIVDRLAVLAIEAKDRLNALESRVARLEKR